MSSQMRFRERCSLLLVGPVEYPPDYCLREDGTAIVWGYEVDRLRNSPAGEQFVQIAAGFKFFVGLVHD